MSVDIEKLEQLAKKATPAPWHKQAFDVYGWNGKRRVFVTRTAPDVVKNSVDIHRFLNNSDYIVAACNAVPELIERVRELEKALIEVVKLEVPLPECVVCWDKDKCADRTHGDNCLTIQDIINVAKEAARTNKQ